MCSGISAEGIRTTAFAFRGYNVTNLGRPPDLLAHPSYGPTFSAVLGDASQTCSEVLGRPVDLLGRVRSAKETTDSTTYAEDVALIVAVETAQISAGGTADGSASGRCSAEASAASMLHETVLDLRDDQEVPCLLELDGLPRLPDDRPSSGSQWPILPAAP